MAIFALPAVAELDSRFEQTAVEQAGITLDLASLKKAESEQAHFLQQSDLSLSFASVKQAVEFCEFFTKLYRLFNVSNPPIRAGPSC